MKAIQTGSGYAKAVLENKELIQSQLQQKTCCSIRPQISSEEMIRGMDEYIEYLKSLPPEQARKDARQTLIKTGVLDEDGNPKENIVSWAK